MNYYNEIDPYCVAWLRNLISNNLIPPGDIDTRPIQDVIPTDLRDYTQCHFFAGIAGWSRALSLAAVPSDYPLWTGSCPCQPFSTAGRQGGFADERHLWPYWFHLISVCRPHRIFGEQVASRDGLMWLDLVWSDLESADYAVGAADIPAAGAGAPHPRQRVWWSALGHAAGASHGAQPRQSDTRSQQQGTPRGSNLPDFLVNPHAARPQGQPLHRQGPGQRPAGTAGVVDSLQHPDRNGRPSRNATATPVGYGNSIDAAGCWNDIEWLPCLDGKYRPTKPGIHPLAHGVPARVAKLRALGNAIVPQVAAQFIKAALEPA